MPTSCWLQDVEQPMDLSIMRAKLLNGHYFDSPEGPVLAFKDDVTLMCNNVTQYGRLPVVYAMCVDISWNYPDSGIFVCRSII